MGISDLITGPGSPLESPSLHNQHAPIPYDQLHHTPGTHTGTGGRLPPTGLSQGGTGHLPSLISPPPKLPSMITDGNKSLPHRSPNPLKSFSVPGPPGQTSANQSPNLNNLGTFTSLMPRLNSYKVLSMMNMTLMHSLTRIIFCENKKVASYSPINI